MTSPSESSPEHQPAATTQARQAPLLVDPSRSWVSMSVVASIALTMFGAVATLFGAYNYLEHRFDSVEEKQRLVADEQKDATRQLERRVEGVERFLRDHWGGADMRLWVERLRSKNPELKVPDVVRAVPRDPRDH